jgi:hypothetical protein
MVRPQHDPVSEPDSRPWLRLAFAMLLPVLWLVAGLAFLSPLR